MKRVVLTVFLAVFAASVIGRSVVRTAAWTADHASGHSKPDRGGARMGETRSKHTQWQVDPKPLQDESLAASLVRSLDPPRQDGALHHADSTFVSDQSNRTLSSRAPPALI
jgi:hypothetical protein